MTTSTKTHWKKIVNPDYLGAYALDPGDEPILTIRYVVEETVTSPGGAKENCTVAHFMEKGYKPMILNITNCKVIQALYDSPYIEDWAGKKIQLYVDKVNAFGTMVEALRIRPRIPKVTKPPLVPAHPKWAGAVKALKEGNTTIDGIKEHFSLFPEIEEKLLQEATCPNTDT